MRKKNTTLLNITNKALSGLLVLLGFSACTVGAGGAGGDGPYMYGIPYAQHSIKGKVENQSGVLIKGIRIICSIKNHWMPQDTLLSDIKGEFTFTKQIVEPDVTYKLVCTDIDGTNNGSYKEDSVNVDFKRSDLSDESGWFQGKATKNITIKLTENGK
ncbi:radical SAM-associated putative lipoprotein [uncultured Bacteroides sp.]|uniref:radical SAM-associated putative lipoprotein n=1 Tax=uncultured Bacteroides sp. TaxID=162156 RepID=UPI002AAA6559|nr:radical SAM-associated putative lipoprotein [uncultured Bacteroides sp.]